MPLKLPTFAAICAQSRKGRRTYARQGARARREGLDAGKLRGCCGDLGGLGLGPGGPWGGQLATSELLTENPLAYDIPLGVGD